MPQATKACPGCADTLNFFARACACGWKQGQVAAKPSAVDYGRCDFSNHEERCHAVGSMSSDTHGGGPWLCADHFFAKDSITANAAVQLSRGKASNVAEAVAGLRYRKDTSGLPTPDQIAFRVGLIRSMLAGAQARKPGFGLSIASGTVPENAGDAWEAA